MNYSQKSKNYIFIIMLLVSIAIAIIAVIYSQTKPLSITSIVRHDKIQKPTDIVNFKGKFVCTELKRNRLAIFDDFRFKHIRHFDPHNIGQRFRSPHYLAVSPWDTLLISNGWGKSIVEITDFDGSGWKEFKGLGVRSFHAPHGIAVDQDKGWIYVGDSLNSRIVRFKDMQGKNWQVFKDLEKKIAYSRQLVFKNGALWISNSYEKRKGLNPGKGANVLRIDDFESGLTTEVYSIKRSSITGIYPLKDQLVVAVWTRGPKLVVKDFRTGEIEAVEGSRNELKIPYGIYENPLDGKLIVAYFGDFKDKNGGFVLLDR